MLNKIYQSAEEAVADVPDGAVIMIGGFGTQGDVPQSLIPALVKQGAKNLTLICNMGGHADARVYIKGLTWVDQYLLVENRQVKKIICSVPFSSRPSRETVTYKRYLAGEFELEMVPQGTLAERIRAGGYGIGGMYIPTGVATVVEEGKEKRVFDGKEYLLERPLRADYAFIRAHKADKYGNLVYRFAMRSLNAVMAPAADITIAEVDEVVEPGDLDIETIVTPAVYVDRIVETGGGR